MADVRHLRPQKRPRLAASFLSLPLMKTILLTGVNTATSASHNQETTPPVPETDHVINTFESLTLDSNDTPASPLRTAKRARHHFVRSRDTYYPGEIVIKDWEESIKDAQLACKINTKTGELSFFTDGSYVKGDPGSRAAVVWHSPAELKDWWESECRTLSAITDNNEAEAFAVALALRIALWEYRNNKDITQITVFTDSQTVLNRVDCHVPDASLTTHRDGLVRYSQWIHKYTKNLMGLGKKVTLRWVKAHMGEQDPEWEVSGNMEADKLAKQARPFRETKYPSEGSWIMPYGGSGSRRTGMMVSILFSISSLITSSQASGESTHSDLSGQQIRKLWTILAFQNEKSGCATTLVSFRHDVVSTTPLCRLMPLLALATLITRDDRLCLHFAVTAHHY